MQNGQTDGEEGGLRDWMGGISDGEREGGRKARAGLVGPSAGWVVRIGYSYYIQPLENGTSVMNYDVAIGESGEWGAAAVHPADRKMENAAAAIAAGVVVAVILPYRNFVALFLPFRAITSDSLASCLPLGLWAGSLPPANNLTQGPRG